MAFSRNAIDGRHRAGLRRRAVPQQDQDSGERAEMVQPIQAMAVSARLHLDGSPAYPF
jgi:hypothetical protein